MTWLQARAVAKARGLPLLIAHKWLTLPLKQAGALVFSKGKNYGQNSPFWLQDGLLARGNNHRLYGADGAPTPEGGVDGGMAGGVFYVNRPIRMELNPTRRFAVVLKAKAGSAKAKTSRGHRPAPPGD